MKKMSPINVSLAVIAIAAAIAFGSLVIRDATAQVKPAASGAASTSTSGPAAYWTTLPYKAMLDAVRRAKVPCVYSFSAGTFLCNQMTYLALQWCAKHSPATKVGFIHLPSLPSQMHKSESPKPVMDLATSVKAVRAAMKSITKV